MKITSAHLARALLLCGSLTRADLPATSAATTTTSAPAPTSELSPEVKKLIADLSSDDFHLRDAAAKKLLNHPEARRPLEFLASKKENERGELGERAAEILKLIDWGVRLETPADVLALLHKCRYLVANEPPENLSVKERNQFDDDEAARIDEAKSHRPELFDACIASGDERIALRLLADDALNSASNGFSLFNEILERHTCDWIAKGQPEKSLAIYERILLMESGQLGQTNYAGLVVAMGKSKDAIPKWSKLAEESGQIGQRAKRVLAELSFVSGDFPRGIAINKSTKTDPLPPLVLAGDWPQVIAELEKASNLEESTRLGNLMLALEFAGKHREAAAIASKAVNLQIGRPENLFAPMLFIGSADETALLAREEGGDTTPILIYEWMGRYKRAMVLADSLDDERRSERHIQAACIRLEFKMGRPEKGRELIKKFLEDHDNLDLLDSFIELQETQLADDCLAAGIHELTPANLLDYNVINETFYLPGRSTGYPTAIALALQKLFPRESDKETLARLRQYLDNKTDAETAAKIKSRSIHIASTLQCDDSFFRRKLKLLRDLGGDREAEALAREVMEASSQVYHSDLAEMLEESNRLEEALREYREGVIETPADIECAYHLSRVLKKLGHVDESKTWLERSKLLAAYVGNPALLADYMHAAGDHDEALKQARLAMCIGLLSTYHEIKLAPIFTHAKAYDELLRLRQNAIYNSMSLSIVISQGDHKEVTSARFGLAEAYLGMGEKSKALECLEIAAKISAGDKALAERIAKLKAEIAAPAK